MRRWQRCDLRTRYLNAALLYLTPESADGFGLLLMVAPVAVVCMLLAFVSAIGLVLFLAVPAN